MVVRNKEPHPLVLVVKSTSPTLRPDHLQMLIWGQVSVNQYGWSEFVLFCFWCEVDVSHYGQTSLLLRTNPSRSGQTRKPNSTYRIVRTYRPPSRSWMLHRQSVSLLLSTHQKAEITKNSGCFVWVLERDNNSCHAPTHLGRGHTCVGRARTKPYSDDGRRCLYSLLRIRLVQYLDETRTYH